MTEPVDAPTLLERLRFELGNIGIRIETRDGDGETLILAEGTGNHHKASYALPDVADRSEEELTAQVEAAVQEIRLQIESNSGSWPEQSE